MALHVYKISEYNHLKEQHLFDKIIELLKRRVDDACYIVIANYVVKGVTIDCIIISRYGIRLFDFKDYGGKINIADSSPWTAGSIIINGGIGYGNALDDIRRKINYVSSSFSPLLNITYNVISMTVIFMEKSDIDVSKLSEKVKTWLSFCDTENIDSFLEQTPDNVIDDSIVSSVPSLLKIERYDMQDRLQPVSLEKEIYEHDNADSLFKELFKATSLLPDYKKVYNLLNRCFNKCLNQKTTFVSLNFGGPFAKTDYLLKEYKATKGVVRATNETRVRMRRSGELSDEELKDNFGVDIRNVCNFISLVFDVDIPVEMHTFFKVKQKIVHEKRLIKDYLRIIVDCFDDNYIYGNDNAGIEDNVTVCYSKGNKYYDFDWTYLKKYLRKGAQLNLIRPRMEGGVIFPELIIYEPDYLVDISSIARCFQNYAEDPIINIINRLQPSAVSEAIVLGNFASQLLDESIHNLPDTHGYKDSVMDFFKKNAISLLAAGIGPSFHNDALLQKINIDNAIKNSLPQTVTDYDPKEGMVEPSFFSEMLGLQGRMDYLQLDYKVLLEQKSGKGEFPYNNFIEPKEREEHYVQMLLYMLLLRYNYREEYEKNNNHLSAFLLYSKYQKSLLGLGFAPELVFRALKVRNGMVWQDLCTAETGFGFLDGMTADSLNIKGVSNRLWSDYQKPQLDNLLCPISDATPLEKAYFFRFMKFIANEHVLSKLGNKTKDNSGFASKWYDSPEEKLMAGNIYDGLSLISPSAKDDGKVDRVVLAFADNEDNDMANFRIGDIVILYPYEKGHEPDARKSMVFRCVVEEITTDTIVLYLRASQTDAHIFLRSSEKMWAIEHDFFESSFSSLYRGMHAFLSAPQERRDLILFQREPDVDITKTLKGDYGMFNDLALKVKQAQDIFLIIGPPGTGKTSFGLLNTLQEELLEDGSSVLLMAYTNRAVDEICSKLHASNIDFIRVGGSMSCMKDFSDNLLESKIQESNSINEVKDVICSTRVFVGTTTSVTSNISLFKMKQFSLAIIDEASQILEPHIMGIISAVHDGQPAIRKFVMIGDHKQLPAVVQQRRETSQVDDALLNGILLTDCRLSLFERFLKKYWNDDSVRYMLTRQGRMHHDIALFPNKAFYGGRLDEVPLDHQTASLPKEGKGKNGIEDMLITRRVAFVESTTPEEGSSDKVNIVEAEIIAATVVQIYELEKASFDVNNTIGVIVPYRNQIVTIRKTIDKYGIPVLHDITIDTVERYQGSQRKYIIYGFTIQKYYQLNFLTDNVFEDVDGTLVDRKLNVAMTRAMEHLIIVGNPEILANNIIFRNLMEFLRTRNCYFSVETDDYINGRFNVKPQE
nr:AAA family ATPase [Prevotella sp.]